MLHVLITNFTSKMSAVVASNTLEYVNLMCIGCRCYFHMFVSMSSWITVADYRRVYITIFKVYYLRRRIIDALIFVFGHFAKIVVSLAEISLDPLSFSSIVLLRTLLFRCTRALTKTTTCGYYGWTKTLAWLNAALVW